MDIADSDEPGLLIKHEFYKEKAKARSFFSHLLMFFFYPTHIFLWCFCIVLLYYSNGLCNNLDRGRKGDKSFVQQIR